MIYNSVHLHATWDRLAQLRVPVWIVSGKDDRFGVSAVAKRVQEQIPHSHFVRWNQCGHFGPLELPSKLSDLVADVALELGLARETDAARG